MKFGPALSGPAQPAPFVATNTGTGAQERWSRIPTQAEKDACATCQDAIPAADPAALSAALQSVIDQGQTSGEFSDQQSITESVYEYVDLAPSPTPNPTVSAARHTLPVRPSRPADSLRLEHPRSAPVHVRPSRFRRPSEGVQERRWSLFATVGRRSEARRPCRQRCGSHGGRGQVHLRRALRQCHTLHGQRPPARGSREGSSRPRARACLAHTPLRTFSRITPPALQGNRDRALAARGGGGAHREQPRTRGKPRRGARTRCFA